MQDQPPHSPFVTQDHEELRQVVSNFVKKELVSNVDVWELAGVVPREIFTKFSSAGLCGLRFPINLGGQGLDVFATLILCEELGRCRALGTALSLMVHCEYALSLIATHGSQVLIDEFLVPGLSGEQIGAIAITEPECGSDITRVATSAIRKGDIFTINGSKTYISNGGSADFITVLARTSSSGAYGLSLFVLPTTLPGFSRGKVLDKIGLRSSETSEVYFSDCRVPAKYLLGNPGRASGLLLSHLSLERLVVAGLAIGACEYLLEAMLEYGSQREVFGLPIIEHQSWKHRVAQLVAELEALKALTYQAGYHFENRHYRAYEQVAMTKLLAAQVAQEVSREALQMHGAFGQIEESPIPRYFRDLSAFSVGAGTSEIMNEIIARSFFKRT